MQVQWYLHRFDYDRYIHLRPMLRAAVLPEGFARIAAGPEVDAIVEALEEDEIPLTQARSELVRAVCCLGEPLAFDASLPRLIGGLDRVVGMEDATGLMNAMLTGRRNLEAWMLPSASLAGFLTPHEVMGINAACQSIGQRTLRRVRMRGMRTRQGGLLGSVVGLLRHLRNSGPQLADTLRLMIDLLEEAAEREEGIAAITADATQ